jgi:WD40 repeat protein
MKFKKLLSVAVVTVIAAVSSFSQPASLKFKLTDFKNPNEFLGRPALIRFSDDGRMLAVSGKSTDIIVYETEGGAIKAKIDGKGYNAFSFLPGGETAVARDNDLQLRVFDLSTGKMVRELKGVVATGDEASGSVTRGIFGGLEMEPVDLSPDARKAIILRGSRRFQLVDFASDKLIHEFTNPEKTRAGLMMIKALYGFEQSFLIGLLTMRAETSFTPDGRRVIASNLSRTATLWDTESGQMVAKLGPLKNTIINQAFSPDGKLLATTDAEGITMIWNVEDGKLLSTIGSEKDSNYIAAWSPDSKGIWTIAHKEDARLYDALTGAEKMKLDGSRAAAIAYSPDGRLLLTKALNVKGVHGALWDAGTGKQTAIIPHIKKEELSYRLLIDPTGKYVVSASRKYVKIYDLAGKELQTLENAVYPVRFNRDGSLLTTGGMNDTGMVWTLAK